MTLPKFKRLPRIDKDKIINDIQALYVVYNKEHSATLSFRKIKTLTKHSTRLIQYCLYSDPNFKKEMRDIFNKKTKTMALSFQSTATNNASFKK